ncbi:MAG: response regulator [Patescibacteria group bacterium]
MREKPLILIVDDEPEIREIVKTKLEANGFEIKEASNGIEGVRLAQELKPDIILLDVIMPEMDGVEALLKLKGDENTKDIKVFIFTGKGDPRPEIVGVNRKFALESGAVDFIRKEIELNELVVKLQKTITEMNQGNSSKIKKEELPKK